ncbi:MAG: hypothetical protein NT160_03785, partial [Actinobacteria bacterium]|nr:hypothetical protein [Actinomycetota bacterium]
MKAAWLRALVSSTLVATGSILPTFAASASTQAYPLGEFALSSGSWQSFNQTANASGPKIMSATSSVIDAQGNIVSFGASSAGDLVEYTNDGIGGQLWNAYDLSSATSAPQVLGRPSAAVASGILQVFYRGTDSHLWMLALDQRDGRPWNSYDLSTMASLGEISSPPTTSVDQHGLVRIGVANHLGEVNLVAHDGKFSHSWNAYNLGLVSGGPKTIGSVAVVSDGKGNQRLFYRSVNGHLLQLINDHLSHTIWSLQDLTSTKAVVIDADPAVAVVSGQPVILGVHAGHLLETYLSSQGWKTVDRALNAQALASTK